MLCTLLFFSNSFNEKKILSISGDLWTRLNTPASCHIGMATYGEKLVDIATIRVPPSIEYMCNSKSIADHARTVAAPTGYYIKHGRQTNYELPFESVCSCTFTWICDRVSKRTFAFWSIKLVGPTNYSHQRDPLMLNGNLRQPYRKFGVIAVRNRSK